MKIKKTGHHFSFRRGHAVKQQWHHPKDHLWYDLPEYQMHGSGQLKVRKKLVRHSFQTFGLVASVFLSCAGVFTWQTYQQANTIFNGQADALPVRSMPVVPTLLKGETEGRINLLVLGAPGEGKPGGDLTDTMFIMSLDPVNHQTKLINIPRDLWVKMPSPYYGEKQKINVAFAAAKYQKLGRADLNDMTSPAMQAGFAGVDNVIKEVMGVSIQYHLYISGGGFEKAIDAVGGIELDIKRRLYDPMLALENGKSALILPAGKQTVSGKKALLYTRSQASWGSSRAERAQQVINALLGKVLSLGTLSNPAKLQQMMQAFAGSAYSDMTLSEAFRLYGMVRDSSNMQTLDVVTAGLLNADSKGGTEVLRPRAGYDTYGALHDYFGAQLPDGVLLKEATKITVIAPTRLKASEMAQALRREGYMATELVSPLPPTGGAIRLIDFSGGKAAYANRMLSERYGVSVEQTVPSDIVVPPGTEFAIILH